MKPLLLVILLTGLILIAGCADIKLTPEGETVPPTLPPATLSVPLETNTSGTQQITQVEISFDKSVYATGDFANIKVVIPEIYLHPSTTDYKLVIKDNYNTEISSQPILFSSTLPHTGVLGYTWNESNTGGLYYGILYSINKGDKVENAIGYVTVQKEIITLEPTMTYETLSQRTKPTSAIGAWVGTKPTTETVTPRPTETPTVVSTSGLPYTITESYTYGYNIFSNEDFTVLFPSDWVVSSNTILLNYSELIPEGTDNTENPLSNINPRTRQVTFQSNENDNVQFIALVSDYYIKNKNDQIELKSYWQHTITPRFYDVYGGNAEVFTNFVADYTDSFHTPYVSFDVTIPSNSVYYPLAYTERDQVSYSHSYTFRFNTPGVLSEYRVIKNTMFNSLKTEGRVR